MKIAYKLLEFFKRNVWIILVFAVPLFLYFPSLNVFYTNDDFFFLKVSNIQNLPQFIHFFDIIQGPEGFGMYRPLSTQVFYFLAWRLFNLNPIGLHVISFIIFFGILYLIPRLLIDLGGNKKTSTIAAFLYGTSATHFGHMYYLATFQELLMTFFVLLSCISFLRQKSLPALGYFILALMSKETAVVTPVLLVLIYYYQKFRGLKVGHLSKLKKRILPYALILAIYFGFRIFLYGFAEGNTYIWDFSFQKLINTFAWYFIWSLNIPETFIDFIGPGVNINPNLFKYWLNEATTLFTLFVIEVLGLVFILTKSLTIGTNKIRHEAIRIILFCSLWFIVSLLPVAFLPAHKFTYFLTLPLIGIVTVISFLIVRIKLSKLFTVSFLAVWLFASVVTVRLSAETSWITNGEKISYSVFKYFKNSIFSLETKIVFVDSKNDSELPWSPTETVRVALSDKNFFAVFYPHLTEKISYSDSSGEETPIESRQFLGY